MACIQERAALREDYSQCLWENARKAPSPDGRCRINPELQARLTACVRRAIHESKGQVTNRPFGERPSER